MFQGLSWRKRFVMFAAVLFFTAISFSCAAAEVTVTDAWGRDVAVPENVTKVICSGPGCMRYLVYLQAEDLAVAVDDMEKSRNMFESRPYFIAHPELKNKPLFGEFRGHDNPELIVALDPAPQVIFKTFGNMGHDPVELQKKTGIPVIVLEHGQLGVGKKQMDDTLLMMGRVIGKEERAKEIIAFFDRAIEDLRERTADIPEEKRPTCYIGGVAYKGPHGITSTEPAYPPFIFVNAVNIAADPSKTKSDQLAQTTFSVESLVSMDPDRIFVDLSTLQGGAEVNGLYQIRDGAAFQVLSAVEKGEIYGVLPYNWYSQNHGSILADAYFIGKVLYPDRFEDIDPVKKADEIYAFLVGKPVFEEMDRSFGGYVFKKIDLSKVE
ncbi:MAG TPA: iron ABC transporter substrate-binding protein [Synergistaceae bacterium]|nr:iron ABC transporter substrate-binding protein [Synergistaceae bacterium]